MRSGVAEVGENNNASGYLVFFIANGSDGNADGQRDSASFLSRSPVGRGQRRRLAWRRYSSLEPDDTMARIDLFPNGLVRECKRFDHADHSTEVFVFKLVSYAPRRIEKGQPPVPIK